jgi:hypothetical protein
MERIESIMIYFKRRPTCTRMLKFDKSVSIRL